MSRKPNPDFVQSFDAGHAGEPAGWVHVETLHETPEGRPQVRAFAAYAPLTGNRAGYVAALAPGHEDFSYGFQQGVELMATLNTATQEVAMPVAYGPIMPNRAGEPTTFANRIRKVVPEVSLIKSGAWGLGQTAILGALRERLIEHGAEDLYEPMYYTMAQLAGEHDQLADPAQLDPTLEELHEAEIRMDRLVTLINHNEATITMLADTKMHGSAEGAVEYAANRRHAHQTETMLGGLALVSPLAGSGLIMGPGRGNRAVLPDRVNGIMPSPYVFSHEQKELRARSQNAANLVSRYATLRRAELAAIAAAE